MEVTGYDVNKLSELGLDLEEGIEYCAGDPDLFEEMIEEFIRDCGVKKEKVEEAFKAQDREEYRTLVHALKGTSRTIGLTELSGMFFELEKAASVGQTDYINENHAKVMDECEKTIRGLQAAKCES